MTKRERPIIFSGDMVRAILDGRKTQTRRPIKPQPGPQAYVTPFEGGWMFGGLIADIPTKYRSRLLACPFVETCDMLWVRETWAFVTDYCGNVVLSGRLALYRADCERGLEPSHWRPSIHMPRWASRITLEVVSVRVERVQDITEEDAQAEGMEPGCLTCGENCIYTGGCGYCRPCYRESFSGQWQSIYGRESWLANPWVWVVEFRRVKP